MQKNSLISFGTVLSFVLLASCGSKGPKVEVCILGSSSAAQCHDERLAKGKQDYERSARQLRNYVATNPTDFNTIAQLRSCPSGGITVEICIFGSDGSAECHDDRRNPQDYSRSPAQLKNFVATNADDFSWLVEEAERHCQGGS